MKSISLEEQVFTFREGYSRIIGFGLSQRTDLYKVCLKVTLMNEDIVLPFRINVAYFTSFNNRKDVLFTKNEPTSPLWLPLKHQNLNKESFICNYINLFYTPGIKKETQLKISAWELEGNDIDKFRPEEIADTADML